MTTCDKHPEYKAKRRPIADCEQCREMFRQAESDREAEAKGKKSNDDAGDFLKSAAIGAITGNGFLGGLLGGDMAGGIIGGMMGH